MKIFVLENSRFGQFINSLKDEMDIFSLAPTEKGFYSWMPLEDEVALSIPPGVPKTSIKTFLFPQPETLFEFSTKTSDPNAFRLKEPEINSRKTLLLGVRPCDARSITLNSMPYKEDSYFRKRLENIFIFGLLCNQECSTCFCRLVGGSPSGIDGMDVASVDFGDYLLVWPSRAKGELLLQDSGLLEANDNQKKSLDEFLNSSRATEDEGDIAEVLRNKSLFNLYDAPFWQELADACLNCGICTFLCPTCYCFDIQDETLKGKGRRIRYWDSCMFPLFTQHASGHNPRGDKLKRVRNRFMHKLKYFPDRFGPISCVGCGRCVKECPVSIDIREVLKRFIDL